MSRSRTKVISIYTHKGGVGKTTTAENLAHILSSAGRKVALVDTDRQASASNLLEVDALPVGRRYTLTHVVCDEVPLIEAMYQARENLWIVPADTTINAASEYIIQHQAQEIIRDRFEALCGALAPPFQQQLSWQQLPSIRVRDIKLSQPVLPSQTTARPDFLDYLIVDHAPNPGILGDSFLRITQEIWSPVTLEPLPFQGLAQMILMLDAMFKDTPPDQKPHLRRIVPCKVTHNRDLATALFAQLHVNFPGKVTRAIHDSGDVPDAQGQQPPKTVFEFKRSSRASKELIELALLLEGYPGKLESGSECALCDQITTLARQALAGTRKG
jgi:cellulose biosynthesis protein BcsQ